MNIYRDDPVLKSFLDRAFPGLDQRQGKKLSSFADWVMGPLETQANYSDRQAPPKLINEFAIASVPGERRAQVLFNPLYERAQRDAYRRGVIGSAFAGDAPEPHSLSFAMGYMLSQADISTHCPVTMTGAVAYVLQNFAAPEVQQKYLHESIRMDGYAKTGGTWATEKHSGSDVGQTQSRAVMEPDGTFRLYGQKWFASNASSGMVIATARPEGAPDGGKGLGLYLVTSHTDPRWKVANSYKIEALKDKMGTRGLATAEIDLNGCKAIEIAPPPHGLRIMMEALGYSRVHNAVAAAAVTRRTLTEAQNWVASRETFGKRLENRPMIQQELLRMTSRWVEAGTLAFAAAEAFDGAAPDKNAASDPAAKIWMRIITAVAKARTADLAVRNATKLVELIGGNGYTTDFVAERLLRDAMVLPVWEGPEQIQALDLIRIFVNSKDAGQVLLSKIDALEAGLPNSWLGFEKMKIGGLRTSLATDLSRLSRQPADGEAVAAYFLDQCANILTYALLARDAAWDLQSGRGPLKYAAMQHFGENALRGTDTSPFQKASRDQALYAQIAGARRTPRP